ncbi:MAG: TPM domain-containing protein [Lachnospiraceae bacterium]|nr:TPM domain-containing protein [Lachnospiraceae bacterium]
MKKYLITIACIFAISGILFGISLAKKSNQVTETVEQRANEGLIVTDQRVFDQADLILEEDETKLQEKIERTRSETHTDIVVLTTNDAEGKSSMAYADDFYDVHDFGYEDSHGTGILFLIDMDNREIWFSTSGDCMKYYTSSRIDSAIDQVYEKLKAGEYYQVFDGCIDSVPRYMYRNNTVNPIWYFWIALVVSICFVVYLIVNRGGKVTVTSDTYLMPASKEVYKRSDFHYDTVVTTRVIESSSGGSGGGHTSSGGFSHGGGGRSF